MSDARQTQPGALPHAESSSPDSASSHSHEHRRKRRGHHNHGHANDEDARRFKPSRRRGLKAKKPSHSNLYIYAGLAFVLGIYGYFFLKAKFQRDPAHKFVPPANESAAPDDTEGLARQDETAWVLATIQTGNRSDYAIEEAERLLKDRLVTQAERSLTLTLTQAPDVAEVHLMLAKVYVEKAEYNKAKESLRNVLEREPGNTKARILLATILSSQGNYEASLAVAHWILKEDPYRVEAHRVASKAYLNTERPALAIPHLRRIVNLAGDDILAENTLAMAYCRTGFYDKATQLLVRGLERDRSNSVTYYNLSICYAYQHRTEELIETLDEAITGFGKSFVQTWLESRDYDAVREDPKFNAFLERHGLTKRSADHSPS